MRGALHIVLAIAFSATLGIAILSFDSGARGATETSVKSVLGIPTSPLIDLLTREQLNILASRNFSFFVGEMTQQNGTETFRNAEDLEGASQKPVYLYYALPLQPSHYDFARGSSLFDPYLYQNANSREFVFLHSTEPAGITMRIDRSRNILALYWLKDGRAGRSRGFETVSYDLYETGLIPAGSELTDDQIRRVNNEPIRGTSFMLPFSSGKSYFVRNQFRPSYLSYPGLRPVQNDLLYNIDFTTLDPLPAGGARVIFNASVSADPSVSRAHLLFDLDKNKRFDGNERFLMQRIAGTDRWSVALPLVQAPAGSLEANLGWAFAFEGISASGARTRMPASSSEAFTTNINNRVRLKTNGAYLSTLATDIRQRQTFQDNLLKFLIAYFPDQGPFRGIFFDIVPPAALGGGEWNVADSTPYGPTQISSFITKIKNVFPGLPVFVGASRTFSSSAGATEDARDSLGLVNGPHNLAIDGFLYEKTGVQGRPTHVSSDSYARQMNAAIAAAQRGKQVVLKAAVLDTADPAETPLSPAHLGRRYGALANYLIARGDNTFLWYDGWPIYYPEFDLDLGRPLATRQTIEAYRVSENLYARRFERGLVIYNPSEQSDTYALSNEDFIALRQLVITPCIVSAACPLNEFVDVLANGEDVGRLTLRKLTQQTLHIPARFAFILMQPPADAAAFLPQVSFATSPVASETELSTFSGTFSVTANISDSEDLAGVQLLVDNEPFGEELYEPPFVLRLNTALLSDGSHTISVAARNVAGATSRASDLLILTENNDRTPPTVSVTAPAPGTAFIGTAEFRAAARDDNAVANVRFIVDGHYVGEPASEEPYRIFFDTASLRDGSHTLVAEARDANRNIARSQEVRFFTVNHDVTEPGVAVLAPAFNATLSGRAELRAEASDNVGVAGVQFLVDGRPVGRELTLPPYALTLNTAFFANGERRIGATARDLGGNVGRAAEVSVTLENEDGGLEFTRDLTTGATGEDVRLLQEFLNFSGFIVAEQGAGSPGNETATFGPATRRALVRYQEARGIAPANGVFGPATRAAVNQELGF